MIDEVGRLPPPSLVPSVLSPPSCPLLARHPLITPPNLPVFTLGLCLAQFILTACRPPVDRRQPPFLKSGKYSRVLKSGRAACQSLQEEKVAQIGLFYPHGTQINLNSTDPVSSDQSGQDHFHRRSDFGHVSHVSLGISSDFRVNKIRQTSQL